MNDKDLDFVIESLVELENCVSQCQHSLHIFSAQLAFIESKLAVRKKSFLDSYPYKPPESNTF